MFRIFIYFVYHYVMDTPGDGKRTHETRSPWVPTSIELRNPQFDWDPNRVPDGMGCGLYFNTFYILYV